MNRERRARKNVQISIDDEEHSISDVYENFKITAPAERTIKSGLRPAKKGIIK